MIKKYIAIAIFMISILMHSHAQQKIKVGNQHWMADNLNLFYFRNGDSIPIAKSTEDWVKAGTNKQPACCYFENNIENGNHYGLLYNWYAVNDARGLAPKGWHIPTDLEWSKLTDFLGGDSIAGFKMKSQKNWAEKGNGNNSSGFNGLPGGLRYDDGFLGYIGFYGIWWTATEIDANSAWLRSLNYDYGKLNRNYNNKAFGFSVRCVKD